MGGGLKALFAAGVTGALLLAQGVAAENTQVVQEKLHVIYDPVSREVVRRTVRVVDPHPEMGLEFTWEPAAGNWPGVTPEGFATGPGKLVWRAPGTANYDPRSVHHSYDGNLRDGRFDGQGRLSYRDGAFYKGTWVAGVLQGRGEHLDAAGNRYEGAFVDGKAQGQGIYRAAAGWVYEGGFTGGMRDGTGHVTEPGGLQYDVVMDAGAEVSSTKPAVFADSLLGGLLPAQSGGDAGKTDWSVLVDPRISADQVIGYTHYAQNGEVLILPADERWREAWNGGPEIWDHFQYAAITEGAGLKERAHTQFRLTTADGGRVKLDKLALAVEYSLPHLRPVLSFREHVGCVGFRPSFNFENYGWGKVENASMRVGFRNPESFEWEDRLTAPPQFGWYDVPVGDFDEGIDVYVRNALIETGIDVTALESRRLLCPTRDMLGACRAQFISELRLGGMVSQDADWGALQTDLIGELSYDWIDALGERHHETQLFNTRINLGVIEVPGGLAECGDGGAFSLQAPQYIDVDLPYEGQSYRIDIPFRGNPNISSLLSGLKFHAERSSMHLMQMEASFADGSVRKSAPVRLFYLNMRQPGFVSSTTPAVCTLGPENEATC
ncbi:hypothetical protein [Thalassovita sp.]|uniref:hypothetical protein n=1 Tax=Thalassovita sp. TaxID=1979401 RepID=UPI0029DE610C|nr:hypothetical protein [Thalassovita sp.]